MKVPEEPYLLMDDSGQSISREFLLKHPWTIKDTEQAMREVDEYHLAEDAVDRQRILEDYQEMEKDPASLYNYAKENNL